MFCTIHRYSNTPSQFLQQQNIYFVQVVKHDWALALHVHYDVNGQALPRVAKSCLYNVTITSTLDIKLDNQKFGYIELRYEIALDYFWKS